MSRWIAQPKPFEEVAMYGKGVNKNLARNIRGKLIQILNDLVVNDHSILTTSGDSNAKGEFVLRCVSNDGTLMAHLIRIIHEADLDESRDLQMRSQYVLSILFRLNQKADFKSAEGVFELLTQTVMKHKERVAKYIEEHKDRAEELAQELEMTDKITSDV